MAETADAGGARGFRRRYVSAGEAVSDPSGIWGIEARGSQCDDEGMSAAHDMLAFAIEQARDGFDEGGIPIGAAVFQEGRVIGVGRNRRVQDGSQVDHGEINCLRNAGRRSFRGCTMATTLAPCSMCAGAILQFGITQAIVGEAHTFGGEVGLLRSRGVEVVVLDDPVCRDLLERFIQRCPDVWGEDIGRK